MNRFFDSFNSNYAIDLGSTNTRMCNNENGLVLKESSLVALDRTLNPPKVIEVGNEALKYAGKIKNNIKTVNPLKHGVIAEMEWTVALLKDLFKKAQESKLIKFAPTVVACVPANATGIEKKAAIDALKHSGAKKVFLVNRTISAAVGAGLDLNTMSAKMIVDIGGGSTDIAILNFENALVNNTIRVAGNDFDRAIQNYIRKTWEIHIGEVTAEKLKVKYADMCWFDDDKTIELIGININSKSPERIKLPKIALKEALTPPVRYIAKEIRHTLHSAPPEIIEEINRQGIVITGGSALLTGICPFLESELNIKIHTAPDPLLSVVIGADRIQNDPSYKRFLVS